MLYILVTCPKCFQQCLNPEKSAILTSLTPVNDVLSALPSISKDILLVCFIGQVSNYHC